MQQYLDIFNKAIANNEAKLKKHGLVGVAGQWLNSTVLKLQKRNWANEEPAARASETGIFFSVWVNEQSITKGYAYYNIHALKFSRLQGYKIKSREFAEAFRSQFTEHTQWPNISLQYGPQTLMQGWIALEPVNFEREINSLIKRFLPLTTLIDTILEERKS